MKKKRIISFAVTLCMLLSASSAYAVVTADDSVSTEIASTAAKAYDEAVDGETLYVLNFNYDDTYVKYSSGNAGEMTVSDTQKGRGAELALTNKTAGAAYVGGHLTSYPVTDHVYTVSYYIENTNMEAARVGVQFINVNGVSNTNKFRIGVNTFKEAVDNGTLSGMDLLENGSVKQSLTKVTRAVDTENNNRQYFKAVIDGVSGVAAFYTLGIDGEYTLFHQYKIMTVNFDYLSIGLYTYDVLGENESIVLGDVVISKGAFVGNNDYRERYDASEYGDVIYDVDFEALVSAKDGWSCFRNNTGAPEATADGLLLNNEKATAQYMAVYHPDMNAHRYGSFTYELYVSSDSRTGLSVLGAYVEDGSFYATGFSYFNTGKNLLTKVNGWTTAADEALSNYPYGCSVTVHDERQNPKTGVGIDCNVKIEFDASACTVSNYILTDDGFVKTVTIDYSESPLSPVLYFYAYNASSNASFGNMKIRKGLTVNHEDSIKMLDIQTGSVTDGIQNVRFVGVGSNTAFNRAGMKISATFDGGSYEYDYSTHTVCKRLASPDRDKSIATVTLPADESFLFGYTLYGIPTDITVRFTVTPYVIHKTGNVFYGDVEVYILEGGIARLG